MLASRDVVCPPSSLATQPRSERERDSKARTPIDSDDRLVVVDVSREVAIRMCSSVSSGSLSFGISRLERSFTNYGLRHDLCSPVYIRN
jgi:hypothetical protein